MTLLKLLVNIARAVTSVVAGLYLVVAYFIFTSGGDYALYAVHQLPYLALLVGLAVGVWFIPIE